MRGAEETIPQGFCKDGVSLRFLRWVYEHSRLQEPMMQSEAMDPLSHEQLQAIAKEMRIFSEYPFEEEDRRRKESTREELCAALKQPPRTIAQVRRPALAALFLCRRLIDGCWTVSAIFKLIMRNACLLHRTTPNSIWQFIFQFNKRTISLVHSVMYSCSGLYLYLWR